VGSGVRLVGIALLLAAVNRRRPRLPSGPDGAGLSPAFLLWLWDVLGLRWSWPELAIITGRPAVCHGSILAHRPRLFCCGFGIWLRHALPGLSLS